jgi:DNA-binding Xre family transcriptional regulator
MATHGMFIISELVPLLVDRGINLSVSQVHRPATGTPERLSLPVLAALCDIFDCTAVELIATKAENAVIPKTATTTWSTLTHARPNRARSDHHYWQHLMATDDCESPTGVSV